VCAGLTAFFETYQIAFGTSAFGDPFDASSIIEYILSFVFFIDIVVNFNLAYHGENNVIVVSREKIVKNYLQLWFWIDFMGLFPFYAVALGLSGHLGDDNKITQCLAFLRLFRLIRLYRFKQLVTILQYSMRVSLMWLTLFRNFGVALVWTHFAACFFYFIARQYDFAPDNTWIGSLVEDLNGSERYLTSLYWAVITFTTVGYGDFSPVNSAEQIWGMVYMLLNMIIQAWFIGSITLIIVKGDEETNEYRDTVHILNEYSALHSFDRNFRKRLVAQLKLVYNSREISDEQVLKPFPSSVRRKVLRRLYLQPLLNTSLMKGIREQFVDAFLTTCNVEIFSPGEEVLHRGSISSDLYLLVEGVVKLLASSSTISENYDTEKENTDPYGTSIADSEMLTDDVSSSRLVNAGEFINEIGFFTETPQTDTVRTVTIWYVF
jgi:CRP-like cAMP-binding protein